MIADSLIAMLQFVLQVKLLLLEMVNVAQLVFPKNLAKLSLNKDINALPSALKVKNLFKVIPIAALDANPSLDVRQFDVLLPLVTRNIGFNTKENVVHIVHNAKTERKLLVIPMDNSFANLDITKEPIAAKRFQ